MALRCSLCSTTDASIGYYNNLVFIWIDGKVQLVYESLRVKLKSVELRKGRVNESVAAKDVLAGRRYLGATENSRQNSLKRVLFGVN